MKKLLITAIALLLMTSFAMAADIPMVNPESNPAPVITAVYSASAVSAGDVVCWDADESTNDDKNYVTSTCGADAVHVAGVVWPSAIAEGNSGTIAIYGVVNVNLETGHTDQNTGTIICASSTAGKAEKCATDAYNIGHLTEESSGDTADAMITIVSVGAHIPGAIDPKNGPEIWTLPVYTASALDAGDVVQWCIDDSDGDNDYWVETTTSANTYIVAGVVWPSDIAAGGVGTIAVRGVVDADVAYGGYGASAVGPVCTSSTAGSLYSCEATPGASFGIGLSDPSSNSMKVFVNP
uniref:Uncharacterized protein n=1 Tax=viral metagenome TaxID=1070528 RepID=A0A6M3KGK8_9ZZZZ